MSYLPLDFVFKDRWAVITGIRDPAPSGVAILREVMRELVLAHGRGIGTHSLGGIVFGGARGVDTGALRFAAAARGTLFMVPRLLVIVPCTVAAQPAACARAIRECADEVIELHKPLTEARSYHHRNSMMLLEAAKRSPGGDSFVVGFPGYMVPSGGTRATMGKAREVGCPVYEIEIEATPGGKD